MRINPAILLCLLLVFLILLPALSSAEKFDLDSLLAESFGGTEAVDYLRTITGYRSSGTVILNGIEGTFEEFFILPGYSYLRLDLPEFDLVQAFDGNIAWQIDPNGQVSEIGGFEKDEVLEGIYMGSFSYLFPDRFEGDKEYLGLTTLKGIEYHQVAFYPYHRDTILAYYSVSGGLLSVLSSRLDNYTAWTYINEYQDVDGILWPSHTILFLDGTSVTIEFTYEEIEINPRIDHKLFVMPGVDQSDYLFPNDAPSVTIPFDYHAGHIRLKAVINGRLGWMLLDSGASGTVLNKDFANDLNLTEVGSQPVIELSGSGTAQMVRVDSISIGELTMFDQIVTSMEMPNISEKGNDNNPFAGVLGYDFLSRFPVLIDYDDEILTIYNPEEFTPEDGGYEIEFFLIMKVPSVRAELNGIPGDFIIDLGNPFGLMLHNIYVRDNKIEETLRDIRENPHLISGIKEQVPGRTALATSFEIGEIRIDSLRVLLPGTSDGLVGSEKLAGNIGNLVLQNFRPLFDYRNSRLILYNADN